MSRQRLEETCSRLSTLAGEEDLPRTVRLAAPSPSSALDKRRAPPAPIESEP